MPTCSFCGTTILFGGKQDGPLRFCREICMRKGAAEVEEEIDKG